MLAHKTLCCVLVVLRVALWAHIRGQELVLRVPADSHQLSCTRPPRPAYSARVLSSVLAFPGLPINPVFPKPLQPKQKL